MEEKNSDDELILVNVQVRYSKSYLTFACIENS